MSWKGDKERCKREEEWRRGGKEERMSSGANLYMGLGGIIQEFLQFFRKFKL